MKEKLRSLRIEGGYTQKDLAKKIHSTDKNIWAYENGVATPPIEVLKAYAEYFNVSVDYLLGRTDELGGIIPERSPALQLTEDEKNLLEDFRRMDHSQKIRLEAYIEGLLGNDAATKRKL